MIPFFKKAKSLFSLATKSDTGVSRSLENFWVNGPRSINGSQLSENEAMKLSAVWACVNLISLTISSLPVHVYVKNKNGHDERTENHPLSSVLKTSPNFYQTSIDFWDGVNRSVELNGDAFILISRKGDGAVASLTPTDYCDMSVSESPTGEIYYRYKGKEISDRDVWHIRGIGGGKLGGISPILSAQSTLGLTKSMSDALSSLFENRLSSGPIFTAPEFFSEQQRDIFNKNIAQKYSGALNNGKPMLLEGGIAIAQAAITPKDAQIDTTMNFVVNEICRFFSIPPPLIGHPGLGTAWPTSIEQQNIMFLQRTLTPRIRRLEKSIEKNLLTPSDRARGVSVRWNIDGFLRADMASRSSAYESGLRGGWLSINDVRKMEGLPPIDGGDVPRIQMQNIPITQAINGTEDGKDKLKI